MKEDRVLKFPPMKIHEIKHETHFLDLKLLGKGNNSLNISQAVRNSKRIRPMRHFRTWIDKKRISQRRTFMQRPAITAKRRKLT